MSIVNKTKRKRRGILFRRAFFKEFNYTCNYCGREELKISTDVREEQGALDHIIPLSKGGMDSEENMQLLCTPCNNIKGDMYMQEFDEYMRNLNSLEEISNYLIDCLNVDESSFQYVRRTTNVVKLNEILRPMFDQISK